MKNKKGFTLVEIIIVVVILGLLTVFVSTTFFGNSDKVKEKLNDQMLSNLKDALTFYSIDMKLKDCKGCNPGDVVLNYNCVPVNSDKEVEKMACSAHSISTTLAVLKAGSSPYFEDPAKHCYKLNASNQVMNESDVIVTIYKYNGKVYTDLNGIKCMK